MSQDASGLSIKGESIQSLYGSYLAKEFLVNRRYQRKLVWTVDEKRSFLDSHYQWISSSIDIIS